MEMSLQHYHDTDQKAIMHIQPPLDYKLTEAQDSQYIIYIHQYSTE